MSSQLTLKVVTPHEVCFEGPVQSVVAPGALGYFGVLRHHAPFVSTLGTGHLSYREPSGLAGSMRVSGGYVEVRDNRVLVLTDRVERTA